MYKPSCNHVHHLAAGEDDFTVPKELQQAFDRAVKFLHNKQGFKAKDLRHKDVKPLTNAINKVLQNGLQAGLKTEIPAAMLEMLQRDVFIFSGLKTYAELKEASTLLLDDKGQIKSWPQFRSDVLKVHATYNENYLRAEHQHAIGTAEAVAKWVDWEKDGDKYDLQIRTAGDEKVRYSHAVLDRITLPFSDPFWLTHMIPFDWGCRCNIVQVLKGKYAVTDTTTALEFGNKAVPEIMRYNPAKQGVIFPPKHPYHKLSKEATAVATSMASEKSLSVIEQYESGGTVSARGMVDKNTTDYNSVLKCCEFFAKQGQQTEILPRINENDPQYKEIFKELIGTRYEGKCPDFKVGDHFYELEGFTTGNLDKAVNNMLKRGLKQASRIVIEDTGVSFHDIRKTVHYRRKGGIVIDEVWVMMKEGSLHQVL